MGASSYAKHCHFTTELRNRGLRTTTKPAGFSAAFRGFNAVRVISIFSADRFRGTNEPLPFSMSFLTTPLLSPLPYFVMGGLVFDVLYCCFCNHNYGMYSLCFVFFFVFFSLKKNPENHERISMQWFKRKLSFLMISNIARPL